MTNERWKALMKSLGLSPANDMYESLSRAYSEKHRFYHTCKHIDAMLNHFDKMGAIAKNPAELELAIWFHDAIYKPFSSKNEYKSALWARDFLLSNSYEQEGTERVYNLIMATLHNKPVKNSDEKLIVDIDLTILGASPEIYDEFEHNVRNEYRLVPGFIFRSKRKALLKSFLERESIYNFNYFKDKFETSARENIKRTISKL